MLGKTKALDKTTLSRNLKLLQKQGLIELCVNGSGRRGLTFTAKGAERIRLAMPQWEKAQAELQDSISQNDWDAMWKGFQIVTEAVQRIRAASGV